MPNQKVTQKGLFGNDKTASFQVPGDHVKEMFTADQLVFQGSARPQSDAVVKMVLLAEDPRSPEQVEADKLKEAQAMTLPLPETHIEPDGSDLTYAIEARYGLQQGDLRWLDRLPTSTFSGLFWLTQTLIWHQNGGKRKGADLPSWFAEKLFVAQSVAKLAQPPDVVMESVVHPDGLLVITFRDLANPWVKAEERKFRFADPLAAQKRAADVLQTTIRCERQHIAVMLDYQSSIT